MNCTPTLLTFAMLNPWAFTVIVVVGVIGVVMFWRS